MSSKQLLRMVFIAIGGFVLFVVLAVLLPEPINKIPSVLIVIDIIAVVILLVFYDSAAKDEKLKAETARYVEAVARKKEKEEARVREFEERKRAKAEQLEDIYRRALSQADPEKILEFKIQKTLSKERQECIEYTFLYEQLKLVESISDDSCTVESSEGVVGELSAAIVKQIAGGRVFFTELLTDGEGRLGMRIQVIPNAEE